MQTTCQTIELEVSESCAGQETVCDTIDVEVVGKCTFEGWTRPSKYKGWVFSELTDSLSGPFVHENLTTLTTVPNTSDMVSVTEGFGVKQTDLVDLKPTGFAKPPDLWPDRDWPPTSAVDGQEMIVCSETDGSFAYRGKYLSSPFAEPVTSPATIANPCYFRNAYLAIAETAWMHLGDEHNEKQVHRVDLHFTTHSAGHVWLYVESDEGKVSGQYKGAIKEHVKVFTNVRGRSFRIKMFVATHHEYPWNLREMAVGHLLGRSF